MTPRNLATAALAIAAGAGAVVLAHEGGVTTIDAVLGAVIGWSFIVSGIIAWERRPENAIGPLMVLTGFLQMGAEFCVDDAIRFRLAEIGSLGALLYPVGHLMHLGFMIGVGWVLLAFPTGGLDRPSRRVLALAVFLVPLRVAGLLLGGGGAAPESFAITRDLGAELVVDRAESLLGLVVASLIVVILVRRWRNASPQFRFAIAPVLWAGAAGFVVVGLYEMNQQLAYPLGAAPMLLLDGVLAAIPVGFLVGLMRARLAHSGVAELVVELGRTAGPGHLRDALARALRDPTLTLAYWLPEGQRYVDVEGRPVTPPRDEDGERALTVVEREGQRIGAITHDPALRDNPRLVQSACAAAALALENERLDAELRARVDDLRASRARIVEAADQERRRIERNLHDGTQQRLVSIAMALGLAQAKVRNDPAAAEGVFGEARRGLGEALEELRELSRGIHPGILSERGLAAALDELALRATLPVQVAFAVDGQLPEQVEAAAYYVVCEALANIAKYAHATDARVRVEDLDGKITVEVADDGVGGADADRGSGLRGLTDRVEALGGSLSLSSPVGQGTILRAEIPCV